MRKKNTQTALALSLMASLAFSSYPASASDSEFLKEAQQDIADKQYQSAIINLKNAVSENPRNSHSRALLGSALLATKQWSAAEKEYRKAIELGADRTTLLADLSQILFVQRNYTDLLSETDERSGVPDEDVDQVNLYRGLAALMLRQIDEAQENFDAAAIGNNDYAILAQGYLGLLAEDPEEAIAMAAEVKAAELLVEAKILTAKAQAAARMSDEAISSFSNIIADNPTRIELYPQTAMLQLRQQDAEAAEKTIDKLLKLTPNFDWALITKAMIRLNDKDMEAARELSEKAIALRSRDMRAKMIAGLSHFYLNSHEAASKHLRSISSSLPADHIVQRILTYIDASQGKFEDTDNLLKLFDGSNPNDTSILSSLAGKLASQGEEDQAISLLQQGAKQNPDDPAILTQLGTLQLLQGQPEAEKNLDAAFELNPEQKGASNALVQQLIQTNQYTKARKVAEQRLRADSDSAESYLLLAEVDFAQRQYDKALQTVKQGINKLPDNFELLMAAAKATGARQDFEGARNYLDQALKVNPTDRLALINLYRADKTLGNTKNSVSLIEKTLKQHPNNAPVIVAAATVKGDQGDYQSATQLLKKLDPSSEVYQIALGLLSNFAIRQNDLAAAARSVEQLVNLNPTTSTYRRLLVSLYVRNGDLKTALAQAQSAQQQIPQDLWFQLIEVQLLFQTEQPRQAVNRSNAFTAKYGETAAMAIILGLEHSRQNELDQAEQQFANAYRLKASDSNAARLARTQQQRKNWQGVESTLQQQIKASNNPLPLRIMLAETYLKQPNQRERAIGIYSQLLEQQPDNLVALNNLASLYNDLNRYEEGLPLAEKAYQLNPDIAAIQDTYGYLLLNNGQISRALELLQQAHQLNSADPSITYHYASALHQNGQLDKARELLREITEQEFKEKQKAIALWAKLQP